MLAIVDYEAGNQTSVQRALAHLGINSIITSDAQTLRSAKGIIFPGVGAAGQAMQHLQSIGMDKLLSELIAQKKPLLGICLGCQILLEKSEENCTKTLGLIAGECVQFSADLCEEDGTAIRIPHMGWNSLKYTQESLLFKDVPTDAGFYFVHSYFVKPDAKLVIATTHYGQEFCSVYGRDGLWALQFHVEKSGAPGLKILQNFSNYCALVAGDSHVK